MQSIYPLPKVAIFILVIAFSIGGCKKFVDVAAPPTSVNQGNVYASDATAISVLTGIYTNMNMNGYPFTGNESISVFSGLSADELTLYGGVTVANFIAYYQNALVGNSLNGAGSEYWSPTYNYIFDCNAAIEGLNASTALTPAVKQQLLGEAKFMRAFFYFYLVNLFGQVPLVTGTNAQVNAQLGQATQAQVYQQIVADLTDAKGLLSDGYVGLDAISSTTERVRPNKWAATALLARAYLYTEKWDSATAMATSVINNSALYSLDTLNGVFLANSTEAIWQLQPIVSGWNTQDAITFILPSTGLSNVNGTAGNPVYLSSNLLSSFEPGDGRRANWVDSVIVNGETFYYPYKYKSATQGAPLTEYLMVLRLGEQYLIRAEAEAEVNDLGDAATDLNAIRGRADLANIPSNTATSQTFLLAAIQHERQVELFTEWGHRWLDLKRTGTVDAIMGTQGNACQEKGGSWSNNWQWYPLPLADIQLDPKLVQNEGY
jgi:hypothetical protein